MTGVQLIPEHLQALLRAASEILNNGNAEPVAFKDEFCEGVIQATDGYAVIGFAQGAVFEGFIETDTTDKPRKIRFVAGGVDWPDLSGDPEEFASHWVPIGMAMSERQLEARLRRYYDKKRMEFPSESTEVH